MLAEDLWVAIAVIAVSVAITSIIVVAMLLVNRKQLLQQRPQVSDRIFYMEYRITPSSDSMPPKPPRTPPVEYIQKLNNASDEILRNTKREVSL